MKDQSTPRLACREGYPQQHSIRMHARYGHYAVLLDRVIRQIAARMHIARISSPTIVRPARLVPCRVRR
ncbi:hypothetical protein [Burkholderia sp. SCN-KJ]|uniref:hypothetical protein n=1 Tax=Burkholderia sp. SCN-KJ TaxID=2969248 RepID=UPI00215057F4|nr:hypothetical protein [Burkholderia sp. SCN-KJ]MCR4469477.1 hypothetical protein [Burkholderia sp. SCN-KJ]